MSNNNEPIKRKIQDTAYPTTSTSSSDSPKRQRTIEGTQGIYYATLDELKGVVYDHYTRTREAIHSLHHTYSCFPVVVCALIHEYQTAAGIGTSWRFTCQSISGVSVPYVVPSFDPLHPILTLFRTNFCPPQMKDDKLIYLEIQEATPPLQPKLLNSEYTHIQRRYKLTLPEDLDDGRERHPCSERLLYPYRHLLLTSSVAHKYDAPPISEWKNEFSANQDFNTIPSHVIEHGKLTYHFCIKLRDTEAFITSNSVRNILLRRDKLLRPDDYSSTKSSSQISTSLPELPSVDSKIDAFVLCTDGTYSPEFVGAIIGMPADPFIEPCVPCTDSSQHLFRC